MIDWPGRVSATVFLSGCQLRCPYCHNPELVSASEHRATDIWEQMRSYLDRRREWIDGVVLTGGEPTADPGLPRLVETLTSSGIPVKLDTNGMEPDVLKSLLYRGMIDYVALDVKTVPERYPLLTDTSDAETRIRRSIRTVLESGVRHEFRTTCYPDLIDAEDLDTIGPLLAGGDLWVLQQFRPEVTLDGAASDRPPYAPDALASHARACSRWLPTTTRGV